MLMMYASYQKTINKYKILKVIIYNIEMVIFYYNLSMTE